MPTEVPSGEETLAGTGDAETARREITFKRGAMVGRYVIIERLGAGAMGVVYKAFDPELDRAVAIKLLLGDGSRKGAIGRSRLQREAQAMARIAHPNVIAVHDVGTVRGRVFFAMELVDGEPLGVWLTRTSPPVAEILKVFRMAGAGIAAAHAAGVVHRDFKPDNVLIDEEGRPRVLDFGLARQGAERIEGAGKDPHPQSSSTFDVQLTRTGAVMGTPAYMAPEQFAGKPSDERTDQFAFCVALHEALTGERPFRSYSFATLSAAVVRGNRTYTAGAKALDPAISAALDRGLQTSPDERFGSMTELLEALSPAARSSAGLIMVGVAVLATATAAAYGLGKKNAAPPAEPEPCADAGVAIDALWTEERRQSVLSAFERSGAFNGPSMGVRVVKVLDEHAAAWTEAAGRSCAMAGHERVFTEELAFRSGECLGESLSTFERTIEAFADVDVDRVQSSLSSVEGLPKPESCNEINWLELQVGVPFELELRAALSEVSDEVDKASHARAANDARGCLEQISAMEPRVRELGFGPEIARLLAIRAACELAVGEARDSERTRERAFEAALAAADDLTGLKIASTTAHVLATTTDEFDAAETWIRRAEALLKRHDLKRPEYVVPILNVRGILAARQNQTEAAIEHFEQVAALTRDDPASAERYIAGLSNVGVSLANTQRLDEASAAFRDAVEFASEHWGPRHAMTATQQTKLAQVLVMQGHFETGRTAHKEALEGLRAADDQPRLTIVYALTSLGVVERKLGNLAVAKSLYEEAYEMREQLDALQTSEAAPLFLALGNLARLDEDDEGAERWYRRALDVQTGRPAIVRADTMALVAAVRLERGDGPGARTLNQNAEALAIEADSDTNRGRRGSVLYTIANNWDTAGNRPRALKLFEQAERLVVGTSDEHRISQYRVEYARALAAEGLTDRALEILQAAQVQLAALPYPKQLVVDAQALRDELES